MTDNYCGARTDWTKQVNRGSLKVVNSKAYHFFFPSPIFGASDTRRNCLSPVTTDKRKRKLWKSRFLVTRMCCFLDHSSSRVGRKRENPISNGDRNVDYNSWIFFCQIISGNV